MKANGEIKMKDEIGYQIIEKLNVLVKLNALNLLKDKEFREQVRILSEIGLQPKGIAELLGKTPNNVRVTLSLIRKEKSKKSSKKVKETLRGKENE